MIKLVYNSKDVSKSLSFCSHFDIVDSYYRKRLFLNIYPKVAFAHRGCKSR